MKTYKTNEEVLADIKEGVLLIKGDVQFLCHINIGSCNIDAGDIKAYNIDAGNIKAGDIKAYNIDAGNIKAYNIDAGNIKAGNISYYAVCFSYISFNCESVKGRRANSKHFCLDSEIKEKEND